MYETISDPYCYPGTGVLKNRLGIRDPDRLDAFEAEISALRARELLPAGRLSVAHYRAIHHHLFQDVYGWAGRFRTVRIAKGGSMFCYPEHIAQQMRRLFNSLKAEGFLQSRSHSAFVTEAARFLAELNAIHPFRDGNGRAQLSFMALLAAQAGHPLHLQRLTPEPFLTAMIASFHGKESLLAAQLDWLSRPDAD